MGSCVMRRAALVNDLETVGRIKPALDKLPPKALAGVTGPKAEVVGTWSFLNHTDGHTGTVELNPDNTYSSGGKRIGTWEIKGSS